MPIHALSVCAVRAAALLLLASALLGACSREAPEAVVAQTETADAAPAPAVAQVDAERIANAAGDPANWVSYGSGYDEQRYSRLERINTDNVSGLGLTWSHSFETNRGLEATPLVVDGVLYTTGSWSVVYAFDAATGDLKWRYDPKVPPAKAYDACCDVVNRGVAVWEGKVFVGALDGRLIALDAATGEPAWSVATFDPATPRTITGAPRVVKGNVIIGHGGAEYGVRGYVSAYDADSGELAWRFYTVPGNPADGFENDAMKAAAETWSGQWWESGGGGTVWDAMAYDPDLDQLYIGVGNGSPWNHRIRSNGEGDNLYLSSIVALDPDTGKYLWHYQTTPAETWDYTATQHIILADLEIDGKPRKVLMQAPKNGFFYVLDRTDGELLSAEPFVPVNWAASIDMETGRPVENPAARYSEQPFLQVPSPHGAHNWHPMAFHPGHRLVYIPAMEVPFLYGNDAAYEYRPGQWNVGIDVVLAALPDDLATRKAMKPMVKGRLIARDPVTQQDAWKVEYNGPWNGGVLATAGDLVFQGTADGRLVAYHAANGETLWQAKTQTGVVAAPMTYEVGGEQYVAVMAGYGGAYALVAGEFTDPGAVPNVSRLLVYKLGGARTLPPANRPPLQVREPPPDIADPETVAAGKALYQGNCMVCHGDSAVSSGVLPDLRHSAALEPAAWEAIVLNGALEQKGMIGFARFFGPAEAAAIRSYVISEANKAWDAAQAANR
jgi:PQQ-dependent dehydrogenase (methanol/ethanol family)